MSDIRAILNIGWLLNTEQRVNNDTNRELREIKGGGDKEKQRERNRERERGREREREREGERQKIFKRR